MKIRALVVNLERSFDRSYTRFAKLNLPNTFLHFHGSVRDRHGRSGGNGSDFGVVELSFGRETRK